MGLPVLAAAAIGLQGAGQIAQSQAAAASSNYNAKIAGNNAKIADQNSSYAGAEGETQAAQQEAKNKSIAGAIKVGQGASGIDVNTGSAANVQASQDEVGMLDALTIRSNAARKAYGYQTEAASDEAQAALDRSQAKNDKTSGIIGAAETVLGGTVGGEQSGLFSDPFASQVSSASVFPSGVPSNAVSWGNGEGPLPWSSDLPWQGA